MAKTRLNTEKRTHLNVLANKAVAATPVDPVLEQAVRDTNSTLEAKRAQLRAALQPYVDKAYPAKDMDVLAKYKLTWTASTLKFIDLDTRTVFEIGFTDTPVILPLKYGNSHQHDPIGVEGDCLKLYGELKDASEAHQIAVAAVAKAKQAVADAYKALIAGAKTFEEVVEVWPEAKQLTHVICKTGTEVSLVSEEAKRLIAANMKARNVEAEAA